VIRRGYRWYGRARVWQEETLDTIGVLGPLAAGAVMHPLLTFHPLTVLKVISCEHCTTLLAVVRRSLEHDVVKTDLLARERGIMAIDKS
jgi:hypothetical protein